jgi:hypothetical protein
LLYLPKNTLIILCLFFPLISASVSFSETKRIYLTMKGRTLIVLLLFTLLFGLYSCDQTPALSYNVENTGANCAVPTMLALYELPVIESLPDPFKWAEKDGRISGLKDWRCRRAEIGAMIQHYEIGTKPAPPAKLEASLSENNVMTVVVIENGDSLKLTSRITLPDGEGPFPAVIGVGSGSGSLPADIFSSRAIATVQFNFAEVMAWKPVRGKEPFNRLYPDSTVGSFVAWAWGVSRLIDGLEKLPELNIDLKHLAVTGCSFAGKIALFSGAFDERIALTIAQESGGGGAASWRVTETLDGSRETLKNAQGVPWYSQMLGQFDTLVTKLPYDHHELMAMVAPRALFLLGNPDYEWLADESGYVSCMAAKEVWNAFGVPERFGFSIVAGHPHCRLPDSQRPEVEAFVDRFLLGNETVDTDIATTPYNSDLSRWITW